MAMADRGIVAGTIMVTNAQGESYFLVEKHDDSISFLNERTEKGDKFPMGIIMDHLLKFVNIDSDSLRLMDLTNLKSQDYSVPLFVFDLVNRPTDQDALLRDFDNIAWRRSKELTTLLNSCDFESVPIYK